MAANGGGTPLVKKEEEFDYSNNQMLLENNNAAGKNSKKGISIAERRAAKCGFNASSMNAARFRTTGLSPPPWSPSYFTVPPGISPSALLDSPVMLPNAQAQLSPTTGTFQFPSPNHESLKLKLKLAGNRAMESSSEAEALGVHLSDPSSFGAEKKPFEEFEYPRDLQEITNKLECFQDTTFAKAEASEAGSKCREVECLSLQPGNSTAARNQMFTDHQNDHSGKERSTHPNQEKHQKGVYVPKEVTKYSEDGFYWRKYGQKHVKGSEYPRSYYKCTNTNCPVTKKVERAHDGQIAEIVYKGSHNHPKPQPCKRFSNEISEMNEGGGSGFKTELAATSTGKDATFNSDWRPDILDGTSSTSFLGDFPDPVSRSMSTFQPVEAEFPPTFANQEVNDDRNEASPESVSNEEDDENGECEPKKRKRESFPSETSAVPRSTREPKVVVQIESDIDILDDGYRWRKYGQKVVKGNPNPRSYYKCTTPGCPVRKQVERAANDIKSVITTYEGKHNHEVPSSKTGSLVISDVANLPPALANSTVSTPSTMPQKPDVLKAGKQVQDLPLYLERKPMLNYNELMRSNLPGNFSSDLNFGASSVYPLSFPPFHSLPYGSLLMNSNPMKSYSSSKLYPMIPDYTSLPSQINPVPGSGNVPLGGNNFHYNNYAAIQPSSRGQETRDSHTKMVKPKEEQRDEDELYDTCLSIPNHGNGTM